MKLGLPSLLICNVTELKQVFKRFLILSTTINIFFYMGPNTVFKQSPTTKTLKILFRASKF